MSSPLEQELARIRREIDDLADAAGHAAETTASGEGRALARTQLGSDDAAACRGHRANTLLVDMCGLVETLLGALAVDLARGDPALETRVRGLSRHALGKFLSMSGAVDIHRLAGWTRFELLCQVRNAIVHGFGGIVPTKRAKPLESALRVLEMRGCFTSGGRIRMTARSLGAAHDLVGSVLADMVAQSGPRAQAAKPSGGD
jgi:hypothetical protein